MTNGLLQTAADDLGDLCGKVVLLDGATVGLWFSDPAARAPRMTYDVDVVAELSTLGPSRIAPSFAARARTHLALRL